MSEDILERTKAIVAEYTAHNRSVGLLPDLIAEVEASRIRLREFQNHEGQTHAAMEKIVGNSDNFVELTRQMKAEVERLRSARKSGLYGKYIIQKADGSPVDPEADYFILRLDADPVARIAALEYAIQTDDQKLGEMLEKRVMDHVFSKDDQCRKRVEGWPIGQIKQLREQIAAKDARIKELEEMIRQLGSLAFMGDMPLDQIVAHFIAWGQSNYDYTSLLEAAFLDSLAARLYYEHYPGVSDAYSWHDYPEDACHCMPKEKFREKAREALERIKGGRKDE